MNLQVMMEIVYQTNVKNGWFDKERPISADIALLHSEISEAYEAYRRDGFVAESGFGLSYEPNSFPAEMADLFIRLLDTCKRYGIDLETEFEKKNLYNSRRTYRHGGKAE